MTVKDDRQQTRFYSIKPNETASNVASRSMWYNCGRTDSFEQTKNSGVSNVQVPSQNDLAQENNVV